jgi:lysozyme
MRISDAGLKFIMRWEGTVLHIYKDQVGLATIGVGHLIKPGEDFSKGLTLEQAMELLRTDVAKCENAINDQLINNPQLKVDISQNMFDSLSSWLFNCGTGALKQSSTYKKLLIGDVVGAADGLLLWCKAGGVTNQGLLNRRRDERKVFLTPDPVVVTQPISEPAPVEPTVDTPVVTDPQPQATTLEPTKATTQPSGNILTVVMNVLSMLFKRR